MPGCKKWPFFLKIWRAFFLVNCDLRFAYLRYYLGIVAQHMRNGGTVWMKDRYTRRSFFWFKYRVSSHSCLKARKYRIKVNLIYNSVLRLLIELSQLFPLNYFSQLFKIHFFKGGKVTIPAGCSTPYSRSGNNGRSTDMTGQIWLHVYPEFLFLESGAVNFLSWTTGIEFVWDSFKELQTVRAT